MKYFTISWDDGFKASTLKTADIYEKYGLKTEFNIVPKWCLENNNEGFGDFGLFREMEARGHMVQSHSYDHSNLARMPFLEAVDNIERSFELLASNLKNFDPCHSVFNLPYNESSTELESYLAQKKIPFRTGPGPALNKLPEPSTYKVTTGGWENAEEWLDNCLNDLLEKESGWLVYTAHGLDGEGWGPISSGFLEKTIEKVLSQKDIKILPAIEVLDLFR